MGTIRETAHHLGEAARSVRDSRRQSGALLAGLSVPALVSAPLAAAALTAGALVLLSRAGAGTDPLLERRRKADRAAHFVRRETPEGRRARRRDMAGMAGRAYPIGTDVDGNVATLGAEDLVMGMVVLGDAGAGKTDAIVGMLEAPMRDGSGILYVAGGEDPSAPGRVVAAARAAGRGDDVVVVTPGRDGGAGLSAFPRWDGDRLGRLVADMMPRGDDEDEHWSSRAGTVLAGAMGALAGLRDKMGEAVEPGGVSAVVRLEALVALAYGDDECWDGVPDRARELVRGYLESLPGFNAERGARQSQQVLDHHGLLQTQVSRVMSALKAGYGGGPGRPIDVDEAVRDRRILVVALPPGCPDAEAGALGRAVTAALKGVMAAATGSGPASHVPRRPFVAVLDGAGRYGIAGLALTAARAADHGFAMVYADRDFPALREAGGIEHRSIVANTVTRVFVRGHDRGLDGGAFPDLAMGTLGAVDDMRLDTGGEMVVGYKGMTLFLRPLRPGREPASAPWPVRPPALDPVAGRA